MLKLIKKHLDSKLIKLSLALSLIYLLLFNSVIFIHKFRYYNVTFVKAILELSKDFIYVYFSCFIIFFGLTIQRLVFIIGTIFLFITGSIASYYLYLFKISPSQQMITSFFATNFSEVYEITSLKLIIWIIFSLSIAIYTMKHFSVLDSKLFITKLISAICLFIAINNVLSPQFKMLQGYFPIQYLHNTYLFLSKDNKKNNKKSNKKTPVREDVNKKFSFISNADSDVIAVLVIGESARFDHFGINNYDRDTTPHLSTVKNLFAFKAQSSSNHTIISVPSLLSRYPASELDESLEETSFLSIFTTLGFNTSWIGTQTLIGYLKTKAQTTIYDEVNFVLLPGGSLLLKMGDYDEKMLPYIENILSRPSKQLLVLHTLGSHWDYSARHPKEFQKFLPSCSVTAHQDQTDCDQEGLINKYDNSILYTDFFLYNVISLLKDKNSFLIYVSDHAESLGEDGYYGHGGPMIKEQTTVPFIVWVSDEFKAKHPELVNSIASHVGNEISHDYVFHSMLDCAGINSKAIDHNLSLCSQKAPIIGLQ